MRLPGDFRVSIRPTPVPGPSVAPPGRRPVIGGAAIRCIVAAALLSLPALCEASDSGEPGAPRPPIEGTFIQYQDWMMKLDKDGWHRELEAMRQAGIRLVIIQWLRRGDFNFIPPNAKAVDPTRTILEYADGHDMKVFIGLADADLWQKRLREAGYLERATTESMRVANEAWQRYGRHRSFAGWYLPQELRDANYGYYQIPRLNGFLKRLADHCHKLSGGKPVAIAPAILGLIHPDPFQHTYVSLLAGSGINIVILQDGVGARGWDDDLERRIVPYFQAMQNVCRTAGIELWSDIEIFHKGEKDTQRIPAPIARIKRQLAAESPFVKSFVMFDFFHYMSPGRGEAQKELFDDYLHEFVNVDGRR